MKTDNPQKFKKQTAASFGAKVSTYMDNAVIQHHLLERLLPHILEQCHPGSIWIDAGCGNGSLEQMLYAKKCQGTLFAFDIAWRSLLFCTEQAYSAATGWLCADIDAVPFKPATIDGIISASVLQWSHNIDNALKTIAALLRPGGQLIFSLFTADSFHELAEIRKRFNLPMSINVPSHTEVTAMLTRYHLFCETCDSFSDTLYFPSAMALLKHLSAIGSTSVASERMSRTLLSRFCAEFESEFSSSRGVPLTYTALFGCARKELHHASQ